jgi:CRP-like cAMP-binding protein
MAVTNVLTTQQILQRNYLFRDLPSRTVAGIAALALRRRFEKDTVVFAQGDPGDALYGVASGRVRISASGVSGQEVYLNIMEPGDVFGEIAVMDGQLHDHRAHDAHQPEFRLIRCLWLSLWVSCAVAVWASVSQHVSGRRELWTRWSSAHSGHTG